MTTTDTQSIEDKLDKHGLIYLKCKKCEKHYQRCKCEKPDLMAAGNWNRKIKVDHD